MDVSKITPLNLPLRAALLAAIIRKQTVE